MAYSDDDPDGGYGSDPALGRISKQPVSRTNDPAEMFGGVSTTQPVARTADPAEGTAAPAPNFYATSPAGNSTYDKIASIYRSVSGGKYNPTQQEVSQWGNNVDDQYLSKINGTINRWWAQQQQGAAAPAGSSTPAAPSLSATDFIRQYQQQHPGGAQQGVQPVLDAMKAAGYTNVAPFMYGGNPSHNEISLDGQKFKVLGAEDSPNAYWYTGGPDGGGSTGFADPAYGQLAGLAQQRLAALQNPLNFPALNEYMASLNKDRAVAQQRAQDFAGQLAGRVKQLQAPLLTDANVANQRAMASNALLASRDAALKNTKERRYASGFAPTSGLLAGDERAVDEQYNNRQATIDATLQSQMIQGDEQRRNQATQLQGLMTQALRGGDISALQNQATMSDLENQMFNMDQNRQREILTTANVPVDLTNMGFANANSAAGGAGNGLGGLMQLLQMANSQQGLQQGQSAQNMQGTAFLVQMIMKALGA